MSPNFPVIGAGVIGICVARELTWRYDSAYIINNEMFAKTIREIRVHGQDYRCHYPLIWIKGRIGASQAAIILAKLRVFAQELEARSFIRGCYSELLQQTCPTAVAP